MADTNNRLLYVELKPLPGCRDWHEREGSPAELPHDQLTVVCVDEVCRLRGVVEELHFADLPHLDPLVTKLL